MNIGNITSDNFNLDGNGKDIQIEVYEQLIEQLQQENKKQKEAINKIIEIINYYGVDKEYNDNSTLRHILKDMLDILKEVTE